jgi:uncharacterized protein YigE (DUF2233 family)
LGEFEEFARLFRDKLGCDDALFLDGRHRLRPLRTGARPRRPARHGGYGPIIAR